MRIEEDILQLAGIVTDMRRELHQIPEPGLKEYQTAAFIRNKLKEFGADLIEESIGTGTVAVYKGKQKGMTLGFRADIDALPVTEGTGCDFQSKNEGMMHACGHDGHTAILLGFAKYLGMHKDQIKGRIVLIFQPAEEGPGGAKLMIEEGLLKKHEIEKIIGLHIFPEYEEGKIACKVGGMMARNGEVTITVMGSSAHGAQPQEGVDSILCSAAIIQGLHSIVSRNISPMESAVLTLGEIQGGEAKNIIAKKVVIGGTIRAFSDSVYETIVKRIEVLVNQVAQGYGCRAEVDFFHMYRVVNNNPSMVNILRQVVGEGDYIETPPYMLAEDFSMYQQEIDGMFFFLGARNEEKGYIYPLHNEQFQFDEKILTQGIQAYVNLMEAFNA